MGNFADGHTFVETNNLPSGRWKVRRIRTAYDKELRRLYRECERVKELIRDLGYEELNPPVQKGYKRLFVLTEETKLSGKTDYRKRQEQKRYEPEEHTFKVYKLTEEEELLFSPVEFYCYGLRRWQVRSVFNEPWRTMEKKYIMKEKYKYNSLVNTPLHEIMEAFKEEKEIWNYEQKI